MTSKKQEIESKISQIRDAYRELYLGSLTLLELDSTYWTERWLLRIVNRIASQRLKQIGEVSLSLPDTQDDDQLKANMLEVQVEASLAGHELGGWEETENGNGYQAVCGKCGKSVYVSGKTVYSILDETCRCPKVKDL